MTGVFLIHGSDLSWTPAFAGVSGRKKWAGLVQQDLNPPYLVAQFNQSEGMAPHLSGGFIKPAIITTLHFG